MPQLAVREATDGTLPRDREKAVRIFAKSMYRELKSNGYDEREMVALATELIGLVTAGMKDTPVR